MSKTISMVIVQLLTIVLPMFGLEIANEQLTGAVQTVIIIGTGLYIWYERWKRGDVGTFGKRKV